MCPVNLEQKIGQTVILDFKGDIHLIIATCDNFVFKSSEAKVWIMNILLLMDMNQSINKSPYK